jgi:hypothetical protein
MPPGAPAELGTLHYGRDRVRILIDDRILAHLVVVTTSKLRRGEAFLISWSDAPRVGGGRSSIWVHPQCDLHYKFDGARAAQLDPELLESMSTAAATPGGLRLDATLASR